MRSKIISCFVAGVAVFSMSTWAMANESKPPKPASAFMCELLLAGNPDTLKLPLKADPTTKTSPGHLNLRLILEENGQVRVLVPQDLFDAVVARINGRGILSDLVGTLSVRPDIHAELLKMTEEEFKSAYAEMVKRFEAILPGYLVESEYPQASEKLRQVLNSSQVSDSEVVEVAFYISSEEGKTLSSKREKLDLISDQTETVAAILKALEFKGLVIKNKFKALGMIVVEAPKGLLREILSQEIEYVGEVTPFDSNKKIELIRPVKREEKHQHVIMPLKGVSVEQIKAELSETELIDVVTIGEKSFIYINATKAEGEALQKRLEEKDLIDAFYLKPKDEAPAKTKTTQAGKADHGKVTERLLKVMHPSLVELYIGDAPWDQAYEARFEFHLQHDEHVDANISEITKELEALNLRAVFTASKSNDKIVVSHAVVTGDLRAIERAIRLTPVVRAWQNVKLTDKLDAALKKSSEDTVVTVELRTYAGLSENDTEELLGTYLELYSTFNNVTVESITKDQKNGSRVVLAGKLKDLTPVIKQDDIKLARLVPLKGNSPAAGGKKASYNIVLTDETEIEAVADKLRKMGVEVKQVLENIGILTVEFDPAILDKVKAVSGVKAVSPDKIVRATSSAPQLKAIVAKLEEQYFTQLNYRTTEFSVEKNGTVLHVKVIDQSGPGNPSSGIKLPRSFEGYILKVTVVGARG